MHRFAFALTLSSAALTAAEAPAQFRGRGGEANAARYGWLSSLESGKAKARQTGKPLMVVIRCVP